MSARDCRSHPIGSNYCGIPSRCMSDSDVRFHSFIYKVVAHVEFSMHGVKDIAPQIEAFDKVTFVPDGTFSMDSEGWEYGGEVELEAQK